MGHIDDSGKSKCQGESGGQEKEEGSHGNPVKGLNHPIHDGLFLSGPLTVKGMLQTKRSLNGLGKLKPFPLGVFPIPLPGEGGRDRGIGLQEFYWQLARLWSLALIRSPL